MMKFPIGKDARERRKELFPEFFTIGYGNLTPEEFLAKLDECDIDDIYDVRGGYGARLPCYRPGGPLAYLLEPRNYSHLPGLGKPKEVSFDSYLRWLGYYPAQNDIEHLAKNIEKSVAAGHVPAILCAEGNAFEKDGAIRCHRVIVAQAVQEYLGSTQWGIRHV
jgi:hypothetical protein